MMHKDFYDFLGTKIAIGDVIFSGGRDCTHGRATLMIVRKFTDKSIVGDVLNSNTVHTLEMKKGRLTEGKYCFVTRVTEEEIKQRLQMKNIQDIDPENGWDKLMQVQMTQRMFEQQYIGDFV